MPSLEIEREVLIEAPIDVVWHTVTTADKIQQWFAQRVELDPTPGGRGTFVFENEAGQATHTVAVAVEAVEPTSRFAFRWSAPSGEEPVPGNSTLVEFLLTAEGDERTRLRVRESDLDATSWPDEEKQRFADDHRGGWEHQLGRLVRHFAEPASG